MSKVTTIVFIWPIIILINLIDISGTDYHLRLICQTLVNPALKPLCDMLPKDYSIGDKSFSAEIKIFKNSLSHLHSKYISSPFTP